jgi:catechol 2,3-dioxygenase-like lactoylglutathione lyase family enzyme
MELPMDALHPRLVVAGFAAAFRFWDAVLPPLTGARLAKGSADSPYAHWDVSGQGALSLIDRALLAGLADGTPGGLAGRAPGGSIMLVSRVGDVDAGYALCLRHGGQGVAAPADRPEWGPGLRAAHVSDPEGNLWELQSY